MSLSALLYHPAVSAGLLPLIITLGVCALPRWRPEQKAAIGLLASFLVSAWLAISTGLLAFDSTAKLVWAAVPAFALGWLLATRRKWQIPLLALLAMALPVWLIAPLIDREGSATLIAYWYLPLFNLYLLFTFDSASRSYRANLASLLTLALGIALCAAVGASILYAERTLSLAAGIGALALRHLWRLDADVGHAVVLPTALMLGTLAGVSTVYASVPPTTLILIAVIPWAARLPLRPSFGPFMAFAMSVGYGLLPALLAITYVWHAVGPVDF